MEILKFASRQEAEDHLRAAGYQFLGAPSRWSRTQGLRTWYADVQLRERGAVILFTGAKSAAGLRETGVP
ncbi:hypothetical protein [Azospirillum thermophilum]|uniref:Uncharacterized protein n=1 Tax=Azospirillum thermophilum TaxID=2202148 RepID=A0A2S2CYF4_9PROT|nr:hypothetical protein [Azospirillum thermophilum]AWK89498.1 hypothetical protein DEW08_26105 [Azospirillum thermophilum]